MRLQNARANKKDFVIALLDPSFRDRVDGVIQKIQETRPLSAEVVSIPDHLWFNHKLKLRDILRLSYEDNGVNLQRVEQILFNQTDQTRIGIVSKNPAAFDLEDLASRVIFLTRFGNRFIERTHGNAPTAR